jgi:hypothetical protein
MHLLGVAPHVGVTPAQQQAARGANARPNQTEIRRRIEEARIPLPPSGQQSFDLCA